MPPHRKLVKHVHDPGDLHELTFSCYERRPLLSNDLWRGYLAQSINEACHRFRFQLIAFVFMPEHVHLLTLPADDPPAIAEFLAAVKRPVSANVKRDLQRQSSRLLETLTIRDRPGSSSFRFWQEGPGYDRNLNMPATIVAAIRYIHANPVRRGLSHTPEDWPWSSARWYASDGAHVDDRLPNLTGMPAEFGWRLDCR